MSPGLDPFYSGCFQPDGLYIGIWEATFGVRFSLSLSLFLFFFFFSSDIHFAFSERGQKGVWDKSKKKTK